MAGSNNQIKIIKIESASCFHFIYLNETKNLKGAAFKEGNMKLTNTNNDKDVIYQGSLFVQPTEETFDYKECKILRKWSLEALEVTKNFVKFAKQLRFFKRHVIDNIIIGDIEATNEQGEIFSLSEILIRLGHAKIPEDNQHNKALHQSFDPKQEDEIVSDPYKTEVPKNVPKESSLEKALNSCFQDTIQGRETAESLNTKSSDNKSNIKMVTVTDFFKNEYSNAICMQGMKKDNDVTSRTTSHEGSFGSSEISLKETEIKSQIMRQNISIIDSPTFSEKNTCNDLTRIIKEERKIIGSEDVAKIFVHGKNLQKPLENLTSAYFHKEIHENMRKMKFCSLYRTQSYSIPNILEGRSAFIINANRSGKTFSYLPALLSLIWNDHEDEIETNGIGPVAVIIARSSREVDIIYDYCKKLAPGKNVEIIKASGIWNFEDKKIELLNGCELLITTPPCFKRLSSGKVIRAFNKNRINHLIFDGIHSMFNIFPDEINEIIKVCTHGTKYPEKNPQLIMTSSSWDEYLQSFMKLTCDPMIIFGSYIEAALFAKCYFKITKKTIISKFEILQNILMNEEWRMERTLIVFNSQTEINQFKDFISKSSHSYKVIDSRIQSDDIKIIIENWMNEEFGDFSILLATDESLLNSSFNNIQVLIHFSLPDTWTSFSRRFVTMFGYFKKHLNEELDERASTVILLDDENVEELPHLIDFVQKRHILNHIPSEINEIVQRIIDEREKQKHDPMYENIMPICQNILQFGSCINSTICKRRHIFIDNDRSINIPCDGLVKFDIVGIYNPSHYTIKIREYLPANAKKWISCETKLRTIEDSLEALQIIMNKENIVQVNAKTNDICAVFCPQRIKWLRCKVLEIQYPGKAISQVHVYLLDYGRKINVKTTDLKVLSEEYKLLDPLVTDLRVVNLIPYDNDLTFDVDTSSHLAKFFDSISKVGDYMICKVEMSLHNVIFTETFEIRKCLKGCRVDVTKYWMKKDMLEKKLCSYDENVMEKLTNLAKRSGLYVPSDEHPVKDPEIEKEIKSIEEAQPRWKDLKIGSTHEVKLKHFESEKSFYVLKDDSENSILRNFYKTLNELDEELIPLHPINCNDFCIIKWRKRNFRGIIYKIINMEMIIVHLLDCSHLIKCSESFIYKLPTDFINKMPFQSIHCQFSLIKPKIAIKQSQQEQSNENFRDFFLKSCREKLVKILIYEKSSSENIYGVLIYDVVSEKLLDLDAVEKGVADCDEKLKDFASENVMRVEEKSNEERFMKLLFDADNDVDFNIKLEDLGLKTPDPIAKVLSQEKVKPIELKKPTNVENKKEKSESRLYYIEKHPKIEYRQNKMMLQLIVTAVDSKDYSLEVTDSSFTIGIVYEGYKEFTSFRFYGIVKTEFTSHEKVGQTIAIRLLKAIVGSWPRLTYHNEPNRFIRYNAEEITFKFECNKKSIAGLPAGMSDEDDDEVIDVQDKYMTEEDELEPI
ncbi:CLUMA_CG017960, isoform A [Clunio marinus]|uniref:RNA helicase n=1 Tax=Clunio marinus TaxID=568069 RepID=A0A1J1J152_9DIPT|nr:CLUMA_CG017960, isoform A [Clunio marinus]